jgi:hypothetical protein
VGRGGLLCSTKLKKVFVEECHSLKEKFPRYAPIMLSFFESSTWKCRCKFLQVKNFPKLAVSPFSCSVDEISADLVLSKGLK